MGPVMQRLSIADIGGQHYMTRYALSELDSGCQCCSACSANKGQTVCTV